MTDWTDAEDELAHELNFRGFEMTQDEIIRMAREAGFDVDEGLFPFEAAEDKYIGTERILERFAALVAAHEREKLAEREPVCIDWDTKTDEPIMGYAAPVRTKDLTDDELERVWFSTGNASLANSLRAVIAADREKNK